MIATVNIQADGSITAVLDTDDLPAGEDERALAGLNADAMLEQCAKVAIEAYLALHAETDAPAADV